MENSNLKSVHFSDIFDIDTIQKLQDSFSHATGVTSIIMTPEGLPITTLSNPSKLCHLIRSTEEGMKTCRLSGAFPGHLTEQRPVLFPMSLQ